MTSTYEESEFWPQAQVQNKELMMWFERFDAWLHLVDKLIQIFTLLYRLEMNTAKDVKKINKTIKSKPLTDFNERLELIEPLINYVAKLEVEHAVCEKKMCDFTLKSLSQLRGFVLAASKSFKGTVEKLTANIRKMRKNTVECIRIHEKATENAAKNYKTDAWIIERILFNQLEEEVGAENTFQQSILSVQKEMSQAEKTIIQEWQTIFKMFSSMKNSQLKEIQKEISSSNLAVNSVDSEALISSFITKTATMNEPSWTIERTLDNFPYKIAEIEIIKSGFMHRPGKFRKSNWKSALFVLSDSGFLHCFKIEKTLARSSSTASLTNELTPIQCLKRPNTFYSVCLFKPRVAVEIVEEKAHLFVFKIMVTQPRKGHEKSF